jgi:hypothetical protein
VAISDRIKAEAIRTIKGIERYYEKYGIDGDEAEEREHRIARIEAAMEGCNGLTHDEKVQKTAENLFELTCAQERSYDMMRLEIKLLRDENNKEFDIMRGELRDGLDKVIQKIEESGSDGQTIKQTPLNPPQVPAAVASRQPLSKIISDHPILAFNAFVFVLLLVFISGHFAEFAKLFGG